MTDFKARSILVLSAMLAIAGCTLSGTSSSPPDAEIPAVLTENSLPVMAKLKSHLASAVGRARVELGPEDPTMMTFISVLPPRPGTLETHSLAQPETFDLRLSGDACYAISRKTQDRILLDGIECKPAG